MAIRIRRRSTTPPAPRVSARQGPLAGAWEIALKRTASDEGNPALFHFSHGRRHGSAGGEFTDVRRIVAEGRCAVRLAHLSKGTAWHRAGGQAAVRASASLGE